MTEHICTMLIATFASVKDTSPSTSTSVTAGVPICNTGTFTNGKIHPAEELKHLLKSWLEDKKLSLTSISEACVPSSLLSGLICSQTFIGECRHIDKLYNHNL